MNVRRYSAYAFWEINTRIGSIWVGHNDPIIGHNEPIIGWKKMWVLLVPQSYCEFKYLNRFHWFGSSTEREGSSPRVIIRLAKASGFLNLCYAYDNLVFPCVVLRTIWRLVAHLLVLYSLL